MVYCPLASSEASIVPRVSGPVPVVVAFGTVTCEGLEVGKNFKVPDARVIPDARVMGTWFWTTAPIAGDAIQPCAVNMHVPPPPEGMLQGTFTTFDRLAMPLRLATACTLSV